MNILIYHINFEKCFFSRFVFRVVNSLVIVYHKILGHSISFPKILGICIVAQF